MKVKLKSWMAVAAWHWMANDETCGICRMQFDGCCPDCKIPGDDCPLVWGKCSHVFHMHCILKWLNSQQMQQLCPMCRREWQFKDWHPVVNPWHPVVNPWHPVLNPDYWDRWFLNKGFQRESWIMFALILIFIIKLELYEIVHAFQRSRALIWR